MLNENKDRHIDNTTKPLVAEKNSPGRILLLDDEASILLTLAKLFRNRGWIVFTAINAFEAKKIVRDQKIDVMVVDFIMPKMNGIEFLNKIRKEKPWIRGILLTGDRNTVDNSFNIREGSIYPFLEKPCKAEDLLDWANKLLASSRAIMGI